MRIGHPTGRPAAVRGHRPLRVEALEPRRLLAVAGLLQLNTTVPISVIDQITIEGTAQVGADIVLLSPLDPSALSVTTPRVDGSGTIGGQVDLTNTGVLQDIFGTFATSPLPATIQVSAISASELQIESQQTGTFEFFVPAYGYRDDGTFTTLLDGILDLQSGMFSGNIDLELRGSDGFFSHQVFPFVEPDAMPPGIPLPDPNLASLGDRVFHDVDTDGVHDSGEPGVPDVRVQLIRNIDGAETPIATTGTDANGYYSFYNVEQGEYAVQFDSLASGFDFTRSQAGVNRNTDSNPSSLTGRTDWMELSPGMHWRHVDAGLRTVAHPWQSPGEPADVDDSGTVQALDALRIINRLSRNEGISTLPSSRPPGGLYYDVDGNGEVTAADALKVINFLSRSVSGEGEAAPSPSAPAAALVDLLLPGLLEEEHRRRQDAATSREP